MASQGRQQRYASPWVILAVASGTFAALNGLFAKLYATTYTLDETRLVDTC